MRHAERTRAGRGMRFLTRSLTGVFLAALAAGLLAFAGGLVLGAVEERGAREPGGRPAAERVAAVRVVRVEPRTVAPILEAFGEVAARRAVEIRAPASGRILDLAPGFEEGGRVAAGERLVAIDPAEAEAALARARAEGAEAEAALREAERALALAGDELEAARAQAALQAGALERARSLEGRGVGTAAAIEQAELAASSADQAVLGRRQALAQAEAAIDQARARIGRAAIERAEAERRLAETEITAAFDGVLAEVAAIEGGLVSQNERLARLVDPADLEAAFRLSASEHARLLDEGGALLGALVEVSLGVPGLDLSTAGTIVREATAAGSGGAGRTLYARLDPAPGLRPGDFVRVRVTEPPLEGVASLPAQAFGADGGVLVLGEDERLELALVRLERRQGERVLVRAPGLEGREVVAERSPLLSPGLRVRPLRADPAAAPDPAPGPAPEAAAGAAPEAAPEAAAGAPEPASPADGEGEGPGQGAVRPAAAEAPAMLALSEERRAALRARVAADPALPPRARARLLADLEAREVPAATVAHIEQGRGL